MRFRFLLLSSARVRPHVQSAKWIIFSARPSSAGHIQSLEVGDELVNSLCNMNKCTLDINFNQGVFVVSGQPYPFPKKTWNHPTSARMINPLPNEWHGKYHPKLLGWWWFKVRGNRQQLAAQETQERPAPEQKKTKKRGARVYMRYTEILFI